MKLVSHKHLLFEYINKNKKHLSLKEIAFKKFKLKVVPIRNYTKPYYVYYYISIIFIPYCFYFANWIHKNLFYLILYALALVFHVPVCKKIISHKRHVKIYKYYSLPAICDVYWDFFVIANHKKLTSYTKKWNIHFWKPVVLLLRLLLGAWTLLHNSKLFPASTNRWPRTDRLACILFFSEKNFFKLL